MWLTTPLDDVLSSRAKVALLRVLCVAAGPLSGREVARRARVEPGHASRLLRELVASGVLLSRDLGRVRSYELAAADAPLTRQLRRLFAAEAERLRRVLQRLAADTPDLLSVVLFGSEARGEAAPGSDTDLLIVVGKRTRALENRVRDTCLRLAEEQQLALSWHLADLAELRRWERNGNPLWQSVLAEGVVLRGESLERLRRR